MPKLIVKNRYGVIPNEILNSEKLSLKAKGLFAYLQSKPNEWKFSISRMSSQLKEGKDAIRDAIKELEKFGLLKRIPVKDKRGKWLGYNYELSEKIKENPSSENPTTGNPSSVFSDTISKKEYSKKEYSNKEYNIKLKNYPTLEEIYKKKKI
jgi:DNA-binding MarR family transcriptional regulator